MLYHLNKGKNTTEMQKKKKKDMCHVWREKCRKAKWLSGEALQIAVKRREILALLTYISAVKRVS